jgi:hypothetical protein
VADADRSISSTEEPVFSCGRGCRGYVGDSGGELVEVGTDHCAKVSLGVVVDPRLEPDPKYGDGCGRHPLCATSTPTGQAFGDELRNEPLEAANTLLRAASSAGKSAIRGYPDSRSSAQRPSKNAWPQSG